MRPEDSKKKHQQTGSSANRSSKNSTEIAYVHHQENTDTKFECLKYVGESGNGFSDLEKCSNII